MADTTITDPPGADRMVSFVPDFGQRFLLTVDTEEEFDWSKPLRAEGHTLHSVARLARFQQFCEGMCGARRGPRAARRAGSNCIPG